MKEMRGRARGGEGRRGHTLAISDRDAVVDDGYAGIRGMVLRGRGGRCFYLIVLHKL